MPNDEATISLETLIVPIQAEFKAVLDAADIAEMPCEGCTEPASVTRGVFGWIVIHDTREGYDAYHLAFCSYACLLRWCTQNCMYTD